MIDIAAAKEGAHLPQIQARGAGLQNHKGWTYNNGRVVGGVTHHHDNKHSMKQHIGCVKVDYHNLFSGCL